MPVTDPETKAGREAMQLWLDGVCNSIRDLERAAEKALHQDEDEEAYREFMRRKALLLASLPEKGREALSMLPEAERPAAEERLHRFASSASNALSIGSVFYMSALLYPEDYTPGEPNDLELFARSFAVEKQQG